MFKFIKAVFRTIFLIIIIAGITLFYARYIEPKMLQEKEVTIHSTYVSENAENLKLVVFADTHFGPYYTTEDFKKVLKSIKELNPDIVFFSGDLIDHYNTYTEDVGVISKMLSSIEAPYGKFAVFGNHDYGGGAENNYESIMEGGGFTVLKNEYYAMDDLKIGIIGIDDVLIGYGNPKISSWGRPDYFNIILCHEPDVIDEVLNYNVDLMISSHTHGRQINIKFFDDYILPRYGQKYIKGLYQFENARKSQLYVNSGVGMTKLPFRFLSPPELTCITITR
jgi:Predicted phosphohydrolases